MKQVTCNSCGWVHMGLRRVDAEEQVRRFNQFYDNAPARTKEHFTGRLSMSDFTTCFQCRGPYINFRETQPSDCPYGSTIQPILLPPELE